MGEIPRAGLFAARNAEGETPIKWGKLSGKRTVTLVSFGESLPIGHRRGMPLAPGRRVISQVKGQGSFG